MVIEMDDIDNKIIKMDDKDKKIIEILEKHPEGMSYRGIWNKLVDEKGEHLIAFPTLQKKVDRRMGVKVVGPEKRGKKAVITLVGKGKYLGKKLSEIRNYKETFQRYIENYRSKLTPENLKKIWEAEIQIDEKLNEEMEEVLNDDMSDNLKRELVYAIIEAKEEIEKIVANLCLENEICNRFWSYIQGLSREELLEKRNEQIKSISDNRMDKESLKLSIKKKLMEERGLSEKEAEKYAEIVTKKDDNDELPKVRDFRDLVDKEMEIMREVKRELDEILKEIERGGYK